MPEVRTVVRVAAKSLAVLAGAAAAVACVWTAAVAPWPEHRVEPPSSVVAPSESSRRLVCPGPLLDLAVDPGAADVASALGPASTTLVVEPDSVPIESTPLAAEQVSASGGPVAVSTPEGEVEPGMLAASQWQRAATETVRGLAVSGCAEAADESWLIGGSTAVGRTTLVLLANPGTVASTVSLEVFGEQGLIDAPAAAGIVVPAGSQRVLSLAGLAPDESAPVVHVVADRAPIAASLEQTIIRGLEAGGVELVAAGAAPATRQVIPGFAVGTAGGVDPDEDHPEGDDFPAIRLFAPDGRTPQVRVRVLDASGGEVAALQTETVPGAVLEAPLGDLPAGVFTVVVDADAPVVAAARAESRGDDGRDFVWAQAAAPLGDRQAVAVPSAPGPLLVLANPGVEPRTVSVEIDGAAPRELAIDPEAAVSVRVDGGAGVLLSGADGLAAAVVHRAPGEVAAVAVQPPGPLDAAVRIFTR